MGPCDDLPAKPELLHWGTMRRARRDLVTRLCRASVNSAIKEHGVMCRLTATAFDENDPVVRSNSTSGVDHLSFNLTLYRGVSVLNKRVCIE
ncbi:hypothetical protein AVEN_248099-1 [Araneus ventricosus]|uniref:Uncharacterized protein n=1 Tax=Araneus ventricosus TaxID=182803 RepID=A0A4Y2N9B6_ARAVE|nr:hypothetical protein AVEN_248099-1 [Araneus ventricosus]